MNKSSRPSSAPESFNVVTPLSVQAPESRAHTHLRSVLSLLGGFCAMLAIGSVYGWSIISKELSNYEKDEKLLMGTISSLSVYITFHTGSFYDAYGARASLVLGGLLASTGWLLTYWGVASGHSYLLIGFYQCLCGQAVQPFMLAALESVRNFPPQNKGVCSSVVLTGFGLTSTVMSLLSKYMFNGDLEGFLLFMAISSGLLILIQLIVFLPPPPAVHGSTASRLAHLKALLSNKSAILFCFVMVCFGMELFFFTVNVGSLKEATGSSFSVPDLLTAFSLCNVFARPAVGLSSDSLPVSRAQLLAIGSLMCAVGMACLWAKMMLLGAIMVGLSDGFMFAVWVPLTREIHGNANYGITFSTYLLTLGIGNVIINYILILYFDLGKDTTTAAICGAFMVLAAFAAFLIQKRLTRAPS